MKKLSIIICMVVFVSLLLCCIPKTPEVKTPKKNAKAETVLAYLKTDFPFIKWVSIDNNNAYIGFDPRPANWRKIIQEAALNANEATDFGFHVWAVDASSYSEGWTPSTGNSFGEVTARYGKIE